MTIIFVDLEFNFIYVKNNTNHSHGEHEIKILFQDFKIKYMNYISKFIKAGHIIFKHEDENISTLRIKYSLYEELFTSFQTKIDNFITISENEIKKSCKNKLIYYTNEYVIRIIGDLLKIIQNPHKFVVNNEEDLHCIKIKNYFDLSHYLCIQFLIYKDQKDIDAICLNGYLNNELCFCITDVVSFTNNNAFFELAVKILKLQCEKNSITVKDK